SSSIDSAGAANCRKYSAIDLGRNVSIRPRRDDARARHGEHRPVQFSERSDDRQPAFARSGLSALSGQRRRTKPGGRMSGLATLLFTLGLILIMGLVYASGMAGWIIGSFLMIGGWVAILVLKAADPGTIAVQVLTGVMTMALSLRWIFRHIYWQK